MNDLIVKEIKEVRESLLNHSLFSNINTDKDLKLFMQSHVYAVWDFMSLLKALQHSLTCTTTPWNPKGNPDLRYLINEIVLAEETDIDQNGNRMSHYEMYLDAMIAAGISINETTATINDIASAENVLNRIEDSKTPQHVKQFLQSTFTIIQRGKDHEIAAAFTYGREDLIPELFTEILNGLSKTNLETDLQPITYYFDRHIELDGDEHGPMAHKMVAILCGDDHVKWKEAAQISKEAIQSRILLFNGILDEININKMNLVKTF